MKKLIPIVVAVAVAVGGYFGLTAAGIIGNSAMSKDEIHETFVAWAAEINGAEGGLRYDDFSRLHSARVVHQTIHIVGKTTFDAADLNAEYFDSRKAQARSKICNDEVLKRAVAGFAAFNFVWRSADDEALGNFRIRSKRFCE